MADQVRSIRLVVLDWAGTTVDFGCFGPVAPFVDSLAQHGVTVTPEQVRKFMGLTKIDHLRKLLRLTEVANYWKKHVGRDWEEADVERIYHQSYLPKLLESVGHHCQLVPGLIEVIDTLETRGIKLATTTGYARDAAKIVFEAASRQGYVPTCNILPDDVPQGRPEPWMIRRAMNRFEVASPSEVVKVGDTPADIVEGLNAGVWSVGVVASSSEIGLSEADWANLAEGEQKERSDVVRNRFAALGAHASIETIAELPELIQLIDDRLRSGSDPQPLDRDRF